MYFATRRKDIIRYARQRDPDSYVKCLLCEENAIGKGFNYRYQENIVRFSGEDWRFVTVCDPCFHNHEIDYYKGIWCADVDQYYDFIGGWWRGND